MKTPVGDLVLGSGIIACLALLVVPIPVSLLDLLMIANLGLAVSIILVSITVRRATEFAVFPTLLLMVTLFRLALNVSSTRLILREGVRFDGVIIKNFGDFMAGEDPVIGAVVFAILMIIQYFVITKGAERIAEVSARFQLDSMPVRIMAIESQQSAGLLTPEMASKQRESIQRESDFHSAMEGASRYIKGENIASVLILFINMAGGMAASWAMVSQMGLLGVTKGISLLVIGDGLVNLISSLLVSTSAGVIVTRVDSGEGLSAQLVSQVGREPKILAMTCGFLGTILVSFGVAGHRSNMTALAAGLALVALSFHIFRKVEEAARAPAPEEGPTPDAGPPPSSWVVRPLELALHPALAAAHEPRVLADILGKVRQSLMQSRGILMPEGEVIEDADLAAGAFQIRVRGTPVGPAQVIHMAEGEDPATALYRRVLGRVADSADEMMGLEETRQLLDEVGKSYPTVTADIRAGKVGVAMIHRVLGILLAERLSIRDLPLILQMIVATWEEKKGDADRIAEEVRRAMGRQICLGLADAEGVLRVLTLGADADLRLGEALEAGRGESLLLDPELARQLMRHLSEAKEKAGSRGGPIALLVQGPLRPHLARLLRKSFPDLPVLGFPEIGREFRPRRVGVVNLDPITPPEPEEPGPRKRLKPSPAA